MKRQHKSSVQKSAADFLPAKPTLSRLRDAASGCTGCELYKNATQTVFGEGAGRAMVMFVGEQPGDQEDRQGHPFVGPAGSLLNKALAEAGIPRTDTYVTNAVKHFKWEPQGKRRKHKRPSPAEMRACRPWLEAEVQEVRPKIIVCLGVTAAQSVLCRTVTLAKERGSFKKTDWAPETFVTIHPSSVFRHPEKPQRDEEYRRFVEDLKLVRRKLLAH
jgi:uracil-DNA glycosylase